MEELDYRNYNVIMGLRKIGTTAFVKFVRPGQQYQWPEGLDFDTAEMVPIGIPPQSDDMSPVDIVIPLRPCKKCKNGHMTKEELCCSERTALASSGINWKWTCDSCAKIVYSKGD